ncbi:hypothetical protein MYX06_02270 [Patescibacteria group bacterium AH-259-L05]|nr:hypothetical protein [Patescibacteria group bacterium AH-259-L05]
MAIWLDILKSWAVLFIGSIIIYFILAALLPIAEKIAHWTSGKILKSRWAMS